MLAQRVLRLLLDGVPPAKILCLTFTKAAAANMAERVFKALSHWTALNDAALAKALAEIGAPKIDARTLVFARRLFARTVETPGGLKIHTIHGFCERLLHLFPFEANVPGASTCSTTSARRSCWDSRGARLWPRRRKIKARLARR